MKNILLLFAMFIMFSSVTYASFPVTEKTTSIELVSPTEIDNSALELPVSSSFHFGGFALGFFLGGLGVLLAYSFSGWKGSDMTRSSWYGLGAIVVLYSILILGAA